jgi:hypothetical protein
MPSFSLEPFYLIAQALGLVAFGLSIWAKYQINDDRLKFFMFLQSGILSLHWLFMSQWTAMAISITATLRNYLSIKYNSKFLAVCFMFVFIGFGIATYKVWYNALPVIASVIATFGYFFLHGVRMRTALLTGSCLWLIHNIIVGSIGPALMEVAIIATGLTTIQRILSEEQKING